MRICELCNQEKRDSEYRPRGRGLAKVCKACEDGVVAEASTIADQLPESLILGPSLEVPAGFGFRIALESGRLVIEQDGQTEDGETRTDTIVLSPSEARQLVDFVAYQVTTREAA